MNRHGLERRFDGCEVWIFLRDGRRALSLLHDVEEADLKERLGSAYQGYLDRFSAHMKSKGIRYAPLLIIDDFGMERDTAYSKEKVYTIVNERYLSQRPTIITTNLPINFKKSMKYNPFAYLRSEKDILKLVQTIIANTKGEGEKSGEDFWVKAEKLYYTALIGYIFYEAPKEEKNFATLLDMIDASEVREDDENFKNPIDRLFEALEKKNPTHFAVNQYKKYKLAAGKTAKSILISCGARLAPFDITRHPNYKMLEDFDKRNVFDIEDYLKRSGRVKLSANTVVRRFS